MKALILKSIIFSLLLSFILLKLDPFFVDNTSWDVSSFNSLYEADENSTDIVFIGSSHLNRGIDTHIIDANCQTNSIKISGAGMNMAQTYYNLKEALTTQSPKIVAIETFALIVPRDIYNNSIDDDGKIALKSYKAEYYKRFGEAKYNEISSIYSEERLYHMFNFFRFHDAWTDDELFSKSIAAKLSSDSKRINQDINKGLAILKAHQVREFQNKDFNTEKFFISEDEKQYINKIISLSREHQFELLFFTVPVLDIYYKKTKKGFQRTAKALNEIFKNYDNVKYYDINAEVGGFDKTRVRPGKVNDNQHLNYKGIINTSNLLAKYIKENYEFDKAQSNKLNTIEDILYYNRKIEKDSTFLGNITTINNFEYKTEDSLTNTISVPKHQKNINISGWMFKSDLNLNKSVRKIALKKKNNFIMISKENLESKRTSAVPKQFKDDFEMSGFNFFFDRLSVEKGKYRIYFVIESDKGELFFKDLWKWIIIE